MTEIRGVNECFYCGKLIEWETRLNVPSGVPFIIKGIEAEITAVGKEVSQDKEKTIFEIKVKCPKCKIYNKFQHKE